jgi:transcriptional regulator with XRE-family HTH domain
MTPRPKRDADTSRYRGSLGQAVRTRREKLGFTVDEFLARLSAEGVNLTAPSLYSYEIGHRPIQVDHLPAFAAAL